MDGETMRRQSCTKAIELLSSIPDGDEGVCKALGYYAAQRYGRLARYSFSNAAVHHDQNANPVPKKQAVVFCSQHCILLS